MSDFLRSRVPVTCSCGASFSVTLADCKAGRTVRCPRGHAYVLVDQNRGVQKLDKSLSDLKRSINRINRQSRRRR